MTDKITKRARSQIMQRIRSKNMRPEMLVRRLVHKMGYRYRLHKKDLPGSPDMVLTKKKKIIFIHGCFWHQHALKSCKITHKPKSNTGYWHPKLKRNVERDKRNRKLLRHMGWKVLVIWECELKREKIAHKKIQRFLHD